MSLRNQQSVFCPTCGVHTEQERGASRGERYCGTCGSTFTLTESRNAATQREGGSVAQNVESQVSVSALPESSSGSESSGSPLPPPRAESGEQPPERIWIPTNSRCPAHPKEIWLTTDQHHETDVPYVRERAGVTQQSVESVWDEAIEVVRQFQQSTEGITWEYGGSHHDAIAEKIRHSNNLVSQILTALQSAKSKSLAARCLMTCHDPSYKSMCEVPHRCTLQAEHRQEHQPWHFEGHKPKEQWVEAYKKTCPDESSRPHPESLSGLARQAAEWREIESAPRDGTKVILWWPFWNAQHGIVGSFNQNNRDGQWEAPEVKYHSGPPPELWTPLPAAPALASTRDEQKPEDQKLG